MIRSMTGFARREQILESGSLVWEVRTVNHRYLEVALRTPEELRSAEGEMRTAIQSATKRGKVDAVLQWRPTADTKATVEVNEPLLDALIARTQTVTARATAHGGSLTPPSPVDLLRWPGVLKESQRTDLEPVHQSALSCLGQALAALDAARLSEGGRIGAMIESRLSQLETLVGNLQGRLPSIRESIRARLEVRLAILTLPTEPNRERFEQELSLALSKMDVDEELDRLVSHIAEVRKAKIGRAHV